MGALLRLAMHPDQSKCEEKDTQGRQAGRSPVASLAYGYGRLPFGHSHTRIKEGLV
jgi:hypothetical protein